MTLHQRQFISEYNARKQKRTITGKQVLTAFKWIANIATIIGAGFVAFHVFTLGYALFIVGSFIWLMVAIKQDDFELGFLQVFFLLINFIGLLNNLGLI